MNRTCEEIRKLADDWLDDLLPEQARADVESHLVACAACRAHFDVADRLDADLALLGRAADQLAAAAREIAPQATGTRLWRLSGVAAALVFAVLVAYGIHAWQSRDARPQLAHVDDTARTRATVGSEPEGNASRRRPERSSGTDGAGISIETPAGMTAVQLETSRPDIHLIWLYSSADAPALDSAPADDAPGDSSTAPSPQGVTLCSARSWPPS